MTRTYAHVLLGLLPAFVGASDQVMLHLHDELRRADFLFLGDGLPQADKHAPDHALNWR